MANSAGSYMLNEVLHLLEERGVFAQMGLEAAQKLVIEIVKLSDTYDCREGAILHKIGERLGICSGCLTARNDLTKGVCISCREQERQLEEACRKRVGG